MSNQNLEVVGFKYTSTIEGKTPDEDDLVAVNQSFGLAQATTAVSHKIGSIYKGNAIVGTTEADKLVVVNPIQVAGGVINAEGVFENNIIPAGMSIEQVLLKLLCVEKWPDGISTKQGTITPKVSNPTISATPTSGSLVKLGATCTINKDVVANSVSYTKENSYVSGMEWGYATSLDKNTATTSQRVDVEWSIGTEEVTPSVLTVTTSTFSGLAEVTGGTWAKQSIKASSVGTNTVTVKTTAYSPSAELANIPELYTVSNLGNLDANHKTTAVAAATMAPATVTNSVSYSVTAVYPVFTNISGGALVANVDTEVTLANNTTFTIDYPAENANGVKFAYPSGRTLTVQMKDLSGNFSAYVGTSSDTNEATKRSINGIEVQYKVWTTGNASLGANTFKFILSKKTSVA